MAAGLDLVIGFAMYAEKPINMVRSTVLESELQIKGFAMVSCVKVRVSYLYGGPVVAELL